MIEQESKNNNLASKGMYIHIPFCIKKCNYCDFYSAPLRHKTDLDYYIRALLEEIKGRGRETAETSIETIYLGGGTPSLLEGKQLAAIIRSCRDHFNLMPGAEISLEANPATLEDRKLKQMEEAGVNRLSIGVQSFFDHELQMLGRSHDSYAVMKTVELIHKRGWKDFNLDLIYGLPGQTQAGWRQNLEQAIDCQPSHLSLYLLQLEESTPMGADLAQGRLRMLDEEEEWHMYDQAMEYLAEKGFIHYEISNFALPGKECRHNLVYWQGREYLGLGAGAVSYGEGRRYLNRPDLEQYCNALLSGLKSPVTQLEHMVGRELMLDALLLGLRLCAGINLIEFNARFGVDISSEYEGIIAQYMDSGLLIKDNGYLKFTKVGYFLSNQVLSQFIG